MLYNKKASNHCIKTPSIKGWFKNAQNSFFTISRLIKSQSPFKLVKYQVVAFLVHTLIYHLVRLKLGKVKAASICTFFLRARSSIIFSPPPSLKSKIAMRQIDPTLFEEIYLKNIYFYETIKEGINVVDVGVNIGAYTILAAEKLAKREG